MNLRYSRYPIRFYLLVLVLLSFTSCTIDEDERKFDGDLNRKPHELVLKVEAIGEDSIGWFDYNNRLYVVENGEIVREVMYVDASDTALLAFWSAVGIAIFAVVVSNLDF